MNTRHSFYLALLLSCGTLLQTSCETTSNTSTLKQSPQGTRLADNVYQWINAHRANQGLQNLTRKKNLDKLARRQASAIGQNPDVDIAYLSRATILTANRLYATEVIPLYCKGNLSGQKEQGLTLLQYWMKEPRSKKALNSNLKEIGIGTSQNEAGEDIIIVLIGIAQPKGANIHNYQNW